MKKAISFLFSAACVVTLTSTSVKAQENTYAFASFNIPGPGVTNNTTASANVSTTVTADFSKRFANTSEVKWSTNAKFTCVYFKENSVPTRAIYSKKGKLEYTIRYFNGNQVSASTKRLLIRNGYTSPVTSLIEVKSRYSSATFVKVEDETSITSVQIMANGDVNEYEHYQKAK